MTILTSTLGMEGIFHAAKFRRKRGRLVKTFETEFPNLILNMGLNRLGLNNLAALTNRCYVGTGTTPPQVGDVALENQVLSQSVTAGSTTSGLVTPLGPDGERGVYAYRRVVATFLEGTGNHNLTEVAMGRALAGGGGTELWCRQLFLNESGQPTAVTKLDDELLVITYEVRVYPYSEEIFEGPDTLILGQMYKTRWFFGPWPDFGLDTIRNSSATSAAVRATALPPPGTLYLPEVAPMTNISNATSTTWLTYEDSSLQQDVRMRFDPASFSSTEIRSFRVPAFFARAAQDGGNLRANWHMSILPITEGAPDSISKNEDQELIATFRYRWGRKE